MSQAARSTLVFSCPPKSIHLVGQAPVVTYTSAQLDQAVQEAYKSGGEDARRATEAELAKARTDASGVINGALSKVVERHTESLAQMRALLPRLVSEATARVIAGIPVDSAFVRSVVNDLLEDVAPGAENVEIQLCAADEAKVAGFDKELRHKFPTLRLVENNDLAPGDCLVKTRFGVLDGRMSSKLKAVEGLLS